MKKSFSAHRALILLCCLTCIELHALCISSSQVDLKAKPSSSSRTSWTVGKYTPLIQIDRKKEWVQVEDVDGARHWVHARHLTSKVNCAMVRARIANLRIGPGAQYSPTDLSVVRKYAAFKKLDRDEEWLKLQDEYGHVHWMHEKTLWEPRVRSKMSF
jgi:SH3-like domain-containing protein